VIEWLLSENHEITSVGEDMEKKELLCTVGGDLIGIRLSHYIKQYGSSFKNSKKNYQMIQQFHFWGFV